jgi:hypothetical protein
MICRPTGKSQVERGDVTDERSPPGRVRRVVINVIHSLYDQLGDLAVEGRDVPVIIVAGIYPVEYVGMSILAQLLVSVARLPCVSSVIIPHSQSKHVL